MAWIKGVAVTGFSFGLLNKTTGEPVTDGVAYGYITKNGGAQAALVNTPVHEGVGQWTVDLTAEEMNGEVIGLAFVHAAGIPVYLTIRTEGGGINLVTITTVEGVAPIPYVDVSVYNVPGTVFLLGGTTDGLGELILSLDDGTYQVRLRKAGVTFTLPEVLVVSGDTSQEYEGIASVVGIPADSDICRVYTYCYDQAGDDPLPAVTATAQITTKPYYHSSKYHSLSSEVGVYDPETGLLYWDIVQGAACKISIVEVGVSKSFTVPALSTSELHAIT